MKSGPELTALLQRASQGDENAAEEVLRTYGPGVLHAVRERLSEQLRRDYDSVDFVQDVWHSFFRKEIEPDRFSDAQALCSYLACMARRKVQSGARRETALKRGGNRRRPLDSTMAESSCLADSAPTPSEELVGLETWNRLADELSARDRRILQLRYLKYSNVEIAAELAISEAAVRRLLEKVRSMASREP